MRRYNYIIKLMVSHKNLWPGNANSNLIKIENKVPIKPANNPKYKYKVPISL